MNKKRIKRFQRKQKNLLYKHRKLLAVLIGIVLIYLYLHMNYVKTIKDATDVAATIIAIVAAIAFWVEYYENKKLNEAQFIMELNDQFISNEKMTKIEWELEKYYFDHARNKIDEVYNKEFRGKFTIDKEERQYLVNYLVHLEGIAALIKSGVLQLEAVDDLMSYRFFIALNNPVVQELELLDFADYYKGCIAIYQDWLDEQSEKHNTIPMYDKNDNLLTRLETRRKEKKTVGQGKEIATSLRSSQ